MPQKSNKNIFNKTRVISSNKFGFRSNAGFSLIEILIAMLIMAIMVGVAITSISRSNDKYARQEIDRLLAAIETVRDLAVIQNQEYGLSINEEGYQFLRLNDTEEGKRPFWEVISDNPALNEHEFPDSVEINMAIDGENIFKSKEDEIDIFEKDVDIFEDEEEKPKIDPPQIYFLSTGEQNEFTLAIAAKEEYESVEDERRFYRIQGGLSGNLKYEGPLEGDIFADIIREYKEDFKRES